MRSRIVFLAAIVGVQAASAATNIVGTWRVDPASPKIDFNQDKVRITFRKDGQLALKSMTVVGEGTYRLVKDRLTISLLRRNGVKANNAAERGTEGRVVEGGKAILLASGQSRNGVPVMLRLIRAR